PYIRVTESKGAVAKFKKLGGKILNGPMQVPGGDWVAQGLDLQGAMFAVHSVKPAALKKAARPRAASPRAAKRGGATKKKVVRPARKSAQAAKPRTMKRAAAGRSGGKKARARGSVRKTA